MTDGPEASTGEPFEVPYLRQLVRLMRDNDLSEIDLRRGGARIRLRRESAATAAVPASGRAHPQPVLHVPPTAGAAESARPVAAEKSVLIKSPIVGTFYAAASPEAEPFVRVGSKVMPDTVVCIIEAMKVFNEIKAEVTGSIIEILVDNGAAVEYGQPLFRVQT
jgi:acetyl-CoA carboxylase biotin carboxyl carrier protein